MVLRFVYLIFISVCLSACDPGTPLGGLFHKPRTYVSTVRAENQTSQPMTIRFSVSEQISENACDAPHYGVTELTLQPGEKQDALVGLHCAKANNWLGWTIKVSADGYTGTRGVSAETVDFSVVCVQGSCEIHANCHDGSSSCSF